MSTNIVPTKQNITILFGSNIGDYATFDLILSDNSPITSALQGKWNESMKMFVAYLDYYVEEPGSYSFISAVNSRTSISQVRFNFTAHDKLSVLDLVWSPYIVIKGQRCSFLVFNHMTNSIKYLWTFEQSDELESSNSRVSHVYKTKGTKSPCVLAVNPVSQVHKCVILSVSEGISGFSVTVARNIIAEQQFPIVVAIDKGLPVKLSINFGNGSFTDIEIIQNTHHKVIYYTLEKSGKYTLSVVVNNKIGQELKYSNFIHVAQFGNTLALPDSVSKTERQRRSETTSSQQNSVKGFHVNVPPYVVVNQTSRFITSASSGFPFLVIYKFGDGYSHYLVQRANNSVVKHSYKLPGDYMVKVTASKRNEIQRVELSLSVMENISGLTVVAPKQAKQHTEEIAFYSFKTGHPIVVIISMCDTATRITQRPLDRRGNFTLKCALTGNLTWSVQGFNSISSTNASGTIFFVQESISGFKSSFQPNVTESCLPVSIVIRLTASFGDDLQCLVTAGNVTLLSSKAALRPLKRGGECFMEHRIAKPGSHFITAKMYNKVSSERASHSVSVEPTSDGQPIDIQFSVIPTFFGRRSAMNFLGNFRECMGLNCTIDFGDGNKQEKAGMTPVERIRYMYKTPGVYNVVASCYSDFFNKSFTAIAEVDAKLEIQNIDFPHSCIRMPRSFHVFVEFLYSSKVTWIISVNGKEVINVSESTILVDRYKIYELVIDSTMYGDAGDKILKIEAENRLRGILILNTTMCIGQPITDVKLVAPLYGKVGVPVRFLGQANSKGNVTIVGSYGDGANGTFTWDPENGPLNTTYTYVKPGVYVYSWICQNSVSSINGSGIISVLYPVTGLKIDFNVVSHWPQSIINFNLIHNESYDPPTNLTFKVMYGDGNVSEWTNIKFKKRDVNVHLISYQYQKADCYRATVMLRNQVGRKSFNVDVKILSNFTASVLSVENKLPVPTSSSKAIYLNSKYPINISVNSGGSKCSKYSWKVFTDDRLAWTKTTNDSQVIVNKFIGSRGSYVFEVFILNPLNNVTLRRELYLRPFISGLLLLTSTPDLDGRVNFTLLIETHGANMSISWNFGDGTVLNETAHLFVPAADIPGIYNIPGVEKYNLSTYQGFIRRHTYFRDGLYTVVVNVNDVMTKLSVTRTVFLSHVIHCERPAVEILKQESGRLSFNADEAFVIPSNISVKCGNSSLAVFEWKLYKSNLEMMKRSQVAESDKMIR